MFSATDSARSLAAMMDSHSLVDMQDRWIPRCLLAALLALPSSIAGALEPAAAIKVIPLLETSRTWSGAAIQYPEGSAQITGLLIEIAPGGETGWHAHPVPSFAVVIEGELEVRLPSGAKRRVRAYESFAEVIDTAHNGRNVSDGPLKLIVFYAGAVDRQLSAPVSTETDR